MRNICAIIIIKEAQKIKKEGAKVKGKIRYFVKFVMFSLNLCWPRFFKGGVLGPWLMNGFMFGI